MNGDEYLTYIIHILLINFNNRITKQIIERRRTKKEHQFSHTHIQTQIHKSTEKPKEPQKGI